MAGKKDSKGRRKWGNGNEEEWGTAQEKQNARKNVKRKKENTVRKQLHTNLNTLLHLSVRSLPRAWQHHKERQEVIFTLTDSSFDLLTRIFWVTCFHLMYPFFTMSLHAILRKEQSSRPFTMEGWGREPDQSTCGCGYQPEKDVRVTWELMRMSMPEPIPISLNSGGTCPSSRAIPMNSQSCEHCFKACWWSIKPSSDIRSAKLP